ncbi:MAG: glyceraldehyde-3-phosphate dehydrogenase, partial [Desulfuromonadales bacterium]|nr:glyceraldehyde-3-phosphate dehydrogenase [Desulfuromonadales bacterium]
MEIQDKYFKDWSEREAIGESMLPLIGKLYRDHGVITSVYGKSLVHKSVVDILRIHRFARQILENELSVRNSAPILKAMEKLDLAPGRIDIGKLTVRYMTQAAGSGIALDDFVRQELTLINTGTRSALSKPQDIVLYGFGRIGRLVARILIDKA